MTDGWVIVRTKDPFRTVLVFDMPDDKDVEWMAEGFSKLPNSPFDGVWSVKKTQLQPEAKEWTSE